MREYVVRALWDEEANVWVAESSDVPGLVTEAETVEILMDKLRVMVPELLVLNGEEPQEYYPLHLISERSELIGLHS